MDFPEEEGPERAIVSVRRVMGGGGGGSVVICVFAWEMLGFGVE